MENNELESPTLPNVSGGVPLDTSSPEIQEFVKSDSLPTAQAAMRKRALLTVLIPVGLLLLLLFGFILLRSINNNSTVEPLTSQQQPVNEVDLSKLPTLPLEVNNEDVAEVVFNNTLVANNALVLSPALQPTESVSGQIYYDQLTNEVRVYNGDEYIPLVSGEVGQQICYIGGDCGFALGSDIPEIPDIPDAVELPQDLAVTASPTFAGLTITNDLSVSSGGTGASSFGNNTVLVGNGTGAIGTTNTPAAGQLVVANASGTPQFVTITGDITVSSAGNAALASNSVDSTELVSSGVTAGTYGNGANYPIFTVDADGRITSASQQSLGGGSGVTTLNTLFGNLTLQGTADQINVVSGGTTITLSTPQSIATTSSPTFGGLSVTNNVSLGGTLTVGATVFSETDLTPLDDGTITLGTETTGAYDATPDTIGDDNTITSNEITDGTIAEADLNVTNGGAGVDGYFLSYNDATGDFTWVADGSGGVTDTFASLQVDGVAQSTNAITLDFDGTDFSVTETPTDDFDISLANNDLTVSAGTGLSGGGLVALGGSTTLNLANTAVTPGAYGSASSVGTFTVDAQGRLTAASNTSIALNGNQITSGTVNDLRLSANVSLLGSDIALNTAEVTGTLPVANGGTGATTAVGARTNLSAAGSGANSDITSTTALNTITPSGALTVGATGQNLTLQGTAATTLTATDSGFTTSLAFATPTADTTVTVPNNVGGTICTTAGNCLGGGGGGANTALSNLVSVAINTSLLPGAATIDLGNDASPFRDAYLANTIIFEGSAADTNETVLSVVNPTADVTYRLPDASTGTYDICTTDGNCVGGGGGGAPNNAAYVTIGNDGTLSDERAITTGTNISIADGGANSTVTVNVVDNPTFSGLLSLTSAGTALSITNNATIGGTLTVGSTVFSEADLDALDNGSITLGVETTGTYDSTDDTVSGTVDTSEIADGTIAEADLNVTNGGAVVDGYFLSYNDATGDFTWVADGSGGVTDTFAGVKINDSVLQNTGAPTIDFGTDFSVSETPADEFNVSLANNDLTVTAGTGLSGGGLIALGGSATINLANTAVTPNSYGSASSVATFTVDAQGRLTAAGNTAISIDASAISSGTLPLARGGTGQTTQQTAINALSGLTTNGDILYHNGTNAVRLARGSDGQCITASPTTILWGSCAGSGTTFFSLSADSGTDQDINGGDTVEIAGGTNISTVASATDTVTVNLINNPTLSGLLTLNGGLTVEAGDTFTFNGDAFTDLTGTGLTVVGNALTVDNSSASGFFQQGGNSFSATAVLGTNDAQSLQFEVGGVDALTIADGGAITVQNETDSTTGFQILDTDGGTPILNVDTTNERVGIGTASPGTRLEVRDSAAVLTVARDYASDNNTARNVARFVREYSGGAGADGIGARIGFQVETETNGTVENAGFLNFIATDATAGTIDSDFTVTTLLDATENERLRVTSAGNVGIGTTDPDDLLHVSNAGSARIRFENTTQATEWVTGNNSDGNFITSLIGSAFTELIILQNGNVGIGQSSAAAKLDVLLSSTSTTAATEQGQQLTVTDTGVVTTGTDTTEGLQLAVTRTGATGGTINTVGLEIDVTGDTGGTSTVTGLDVNVSGADTNYAAIFQGGDVGVGTAGPGYGLDVLGTVRLQTPTDIANSQVLRLEGPDRATPADNDSIYISSFLDTATSPGEFSRIETIGTDVTPTSKDGTLSLQVISNNSLVEYLRLTSDDSANRNIVFNEDSADINFRVESDNEENALYVEGGNGRVGIGTATPDTVLQVVAADNVYDGVIVDVDNGSSGAALRIRTAANPQVAADTDTSFIVTSTGNVGIGMGSSDPSTPLQVVAADNSGDGITVDVDSAGSAGYALKLRADVTPALNDDADIVFGVTNIGSVLFQNATDSTTGFQVLDADGGVPVLNIDTTNERIGIGTDTPAARLDVRTTAAALLRLERAGGAGWVELREGGTLKTYLGFETAAGGGIATGSLGNSTVLRSENALHLTSGSSALNGITLATSGDVGIGTTGPSQILEVVGSTSPLFNRANTVDGNSSRAVLSLQRTYNGGAGADGIGGYLDFYVETETEGTVERSGTIEVIATDATAGTLDSDIYLRPVLDGSLVNEALVVKSSGNVGVGTSAPVNTLSVVGSVDVAGTASGTITGTADPDGTATLEGSGTAFDTELVIGDRITINFETRTVVSITDADTLVVDTAFSDTASAAVTRLPALLTVQDSSSNLDFVVNDQGSVGIGVLGPSGILEVDGGTLGIGITDIDLQAATGSTTLSGNSVNIAAGSVLGTEAVTLAGHGGSITISAGDGGTSEESGTSGDGGDIIFNVGSQGGGTGSGGSGNAGNFQINLGSGPGSFLEVDSPTSTSHFTIFDLVSDVGFANNSVLSVDAEGDLLTDGDVQAVGDLRVGFGGTPSLTLNGEDAYIEGTLEVDGQVRLDGQLNSYGNVNLGNDTADDIVFNGYIASSILPDAAGTYDLGSTSLEFRDVFLSDNNGINFGLDQDAELAYDESGDDRVELTGSGASLFIEDRLGFGVQTLTLTDDGVANDALTPTSSYVRIDVDETANAGVPDLTISEASAADGDLLIIVNNEQDASNDTFTITNSAGVVQLPGATTLTLGPNDSVTLVYMNDRWVTLANSDN